MSSQKGMTLCLYYNPISPPCRHVMLTAKLLKLDLNLICLNLLKGDHLKRSFLRVSTCLLLCKETKCNYIFFSVESRTQNTNSY